MFDISFPELVVILLVASYFLKPEDIRATFIKCKKLHLFVKQELGVLDISTDTDIVCGNNILPDQNDKKKENKSEK